jgi:hypothetical protein
VTRALELPPLTRFSEACALVVAYLGKTIPLAFWSVSRFDGERQTYVCVQDGAYGKTAGGSHAWSDSFCQHMITGSAPQIAPDAMAVPQYSAAGVAQVLSIGAYVGVPICDGDGSLLGTLCGMDPAIQSGELLDQAPCCTCWPPSSVRPCMPTDCVPRRSTGRLSCSGVTSSPGCPIARCSYIAWPVR